MAGVQAGRLSIEIVAEVARLQQDLDKAKRAVKAMSNDIARDTRAANDNLARVGTGFEKTGQRVVASAGAQRAGMQQLTMQIGDMATMYALGARPMQIFASQSAQVIGAIQLMSGGTSKFATFMGGPWGAAITAGTLILAPFIAKLFEAEDAVQKVEWATSAMADAQGILGSVLDLTTGKINTQSQALLALARAQLIAGQIESRRQQAEARSEMVGIRKGSIELQGGMGGGLRAVRTGDASADVVSAFQDGTLSIREAERSLRSLWQTGLITEKSYLKAAEAVTKFGVAAENIKVYEDAEKGLEGDAKALSQFLNPAAGRKPPRPRKGPKGMSAEEVEQRFASQMEGWTQRNLQAQIDLATDVEEKVELQKRSLEWDRRQSVAQVEADKHFNDEQKARLIKMVEANNALRLEIVERDRAREIEKQTADVAQLQFDRERTMLQHAINLADTQEERKRLALDVLAIEQAFRRQQLEAIIASKAATDAEKRRAQLILAGLPGVEAGERASAARANETSVERYLRDLNKTPAQINEALDEIKIRGLEELNDQLVDAIINFKSMGDVAKNVIRQILSELLRLQIQKAIIGPLANALGLGTALGSSGDIVADVGGSRFTGNPFGGGRAVGGAVTAGHSYRVGENGEEILTVGAHGYITPAERVSAGDGITINQHFAPNFAGNAATKEDLVMMGQITKAETISAVREINRRR